MAGFFGLFNYEKEGPGISKNAPKKKTFVVFFETFMRNFWKFIILNLLYCLFSFPLLTNGLGCAGLTNVTRNIARDKHSFGTSDFLDTVKKNWKQALPAGIINLVIYALLIFDLVYFNHSGDGIKSIVLLGICLSIFFIFTVMNFFIWTLMITFKFSLSQIYKNSFKFVFINLKKNLLCFLSIAVIYAINIAIAYLLSGYLLAVLTFEILIYILLFPCYKFLLIQFCTFPSIKKYIIDPYYAEHPDDDIEKRRDLGIEVETEDETEENETEDGDSEAENVFED